MERAKEQYLPITKKILKEVRKFQKYGKLNLYAMKSNNLREQEEEFIKELETILRIYKKVGEQK